jgi:hypothetical protein
MTAAGPLLTLEEVVRIAAERKSRIGLMTPRLAKRVATAFVTLKPPAILFRHSLLIAAC